MWTYAPSPDAADLPPVAEQDVARTAIIYKASDVTPVGVSHVLSDKSGPGQSFSIAREPLTQAFKKAGARDGDALLVVAIHFKAKGADATGLFDECPSGGNAESSDPVVVGLTLPAAPDWDSRAIDTAGNEVSYAGST